MNPELLPDRKGTKEPSSTLPFPKQSWGRLLYALLIIAIPIIAFVGVDATRPDWWQSGELYTYVELVLSPEASLLFFVLLAYSVICYLLLLISPTQYAHSFIVRFGIYSGALLILQYSIIGSVLLVSLTSFNVLINVFLAAAVLSIFSKIYNWATTRWAHHTINIIVAVFLIALSIVSSIYSREHWLIIIGAVLFATPFWIFLISFRVINWLIRNFEARLTFPHATTLVAWISAYVAAWRFDILKMFELYATLPKYGPWDCYIATAAAQGHPRFVGSYKIILANEKPLSVNRQLQILKCAELALLVTSPKAHRMIRRIYDKLGRPLASRIRNPFVADIAYLLLKPCELFAMIVLKLVLPEFETISRKIYTTI